MNKMCFTTLVVALTMSLVASPVRAERKLERGQDLVETPADGAGLRLHNLFQSTMVLQRDKPVKVWGWASTGDTITVEFAGQTKTAKAGDDGTWQVMLDAMPACTTGRTLKVQSAISNQKLEISAILVGDVWLLGGQSNMEFDLPKVDNGDLEVVSANFPLIRILSVPQLNGPEYRKNFPRLYQWSDWSGRHYRQGYWDVCTPETVREFSAIGYVFARRIHMASQVPIGIIDASRGGTTVETWTPLDVLKSIVTPEVKAKLDEWDEKVAAFDPQKDLAAQAAAYTKRVAAMKAKGEEIPADSKAPTTPRPGPGMDMNRPGNCYASMLAPLAGFAVKGALWHQGFNNALEPNGHVVYYQVFAKMITAWRTAFDDPQMPFGIISLCTAGEPQSLDTCVASMADEGIYIREVHYKTFLDLQKAGDKTIGYASSFDQRRSWFHPQIKIPVGERIARWALATQYGKKIRWMPPVLKATQIEKGKLLLTLDGETGSYNDGPILGFAIAGKDGKFQPATATFLETGKGSRGPQYDRKTIVLSSPLIPEPVHFRHAWGRNPLANLKTADHTDIPFATLRSDSWTIADMYTLYTGKQCAAPGVLSRAEHGELAKALRAADLERRKAEARALLETEKK